MYKQRTYDPLKKQSMPLSTVASVTSNIPYGSFFAREVYLW